MRELMLLVAAWFCVVTFVVPPTTAHANNTRSWVSSSGSDSNACTKAAPCLTFAQAISQTSSGGEIDCLTGGDFGAVTITFPVTIDCGAGQVGTIGITAGPAAILISLNSGGTVVLRNLSLNGLGTNGANGIDASVANGALIVEHCSIFGFASANGIMFTPGSGRGALEVSDTSIYDNYFGIAVDVGSGVTGSVVLSRVEIINHTTDGLIFEGGGVIAGTLRNSVVAGSGDYGILADSGSAYFTVEESSIVDNLRDGILAESAGTNLEVGASTIAGNATGVADTAGSIYTFGNNQMSANGSNGGFTSGGPGLE
jgi:hypothetical protein